MLEGEDGEGGLFDPHTLQGGVILGEIIMSILRDVSIRAPAWGAILIAHLFGFFPPFVSIRTPARGVMPLSQS